MFIAAHHRLAAEIFDPQHTEELVADVALQPKDTVVSAIEQRNLAPGNPEGLHYIRF